MATIEAFEQIISWQEARLLNEKIGKLIDDGTFKTSFRLINQIEGSAGSIMDNIAEGFERGGNKEFIQFLYIAKASCGELRSQLYRSLDRKYISSLIQKLISYLEQSETKGIKFKNKETK